MSDSGTTQQEPTRSAAFGASVLSSHPGVLPSRPGSLAEAQERYNATIARHFVEQGVAQLQQNARSALSVGLSPSDPRSGIFRGERYVMTSPNGRSDATVRAAPVFDELARP